MIEPEQVVGFIGHPSAGVTETVKRIQETTGTTVAHILAQQIRARLTVDGTSTGILRGWTETTEPGLWWWQQTDCADPGDIIVEGRLRRIRSVLPVGRQVGPTVEGYGNGMAFRFDLPWVTDKWDHDRIISILEMIDVLPPVRNSL